MIPRRFLFFRLHPQKKLDHIHFKLLEILFRDALRLEFIVEFLDFFEHHLEYALAVNDVAIAVLNRLRAHRLDVQADAFAVVAEVVLVEYLYLVEGGAKIFRAERLVLIVTDAVLVVQVHAPQLAEGYRESHVGGGIEAGHDRMRAFDAYSDPGRIDRLRRDGERVAARPAVAPVDRLVRLWLDKDLDVGIVLEYRIEGVAHLKDALYRVFAFSAKCAFAREP